MNETAAPSAYWPLSQPNQKMLLSFVLRASQTSLTVGVCALLSACLFFNLLWNSTSVEHLTVAWLGGNGATEPAHIPEALPRELLSARTIFYPDAWGNISAFYRDIAPTFRVVLDPYCNDIDCPGADWRRPDGPAGLLQVLRRGPPGFPDAQSYCGVNRRSRIEFAYCDKFAAEAFIPALLAASPFAWRDAPEEPPPSAVYAVIWTMVREGGDKFPHHIGYRDPCEAAMRARYHSMNGTSAWVLGPERMFFTQPWDYGPCEVFSGDVTNPLMADHPLFVNYGAAGPNVKRQCFTPERDMVVPTSTWHTPSMHSSMAHELAKAVAVHAVGANLTRNVLAMMVGSNTPARGDAINALRGSRGFQLEDAMKLPDMLALALRSKYCLQADGHAPWSPRLALHMAAQCVPVIISDTLLPPWYALLNWTKFSVQIRNRDLHRLPDLLAAANYSSLFANLQLARPFMRYDLPVVKVSRSTSGSDSGHHSATGALPLIVYEMWRSLHARGVDRPAQRRHRPH